MANLKNIQTQIKSVSSIQKVTKAMKMVAAAKLKRAQERMEKARPYSERLENLIADLLIDTNSNILPLLESRDNIQKHALLIIASDRGLAGSFNSNIIKKSEEEISKIGKEHIILICIGKKCYEYFRNRNYEIDYLYSETWNDLNYNQAINIGNGLVSSYLEKKFDSLSVIYNYFKNTASQEVLYNQLLPITFKKNDDIQIKDVIYEPSKTELIKSLAPKFFTAQIWQCLLESFASEQAARMLAMDSATENAKDMISELKLQFNKARQTAITTEMLEIVGGAEALSN
jgi:F-type H+-transporting ATPase subunit gamma